MITMTDKKCIVEEAVWKCDCDRCIERKAQMMKFTFEQVISKITCDLLKKAWEEKK